MNLKLIFLIVAVIALSACNKANRKDSDSSSKLVETKSEKSSSCEGCPSEMGCSGNSMVNGEGVLRADADVVTVYYFHGSRQCKTCKAVGEVARLTVAKYFSGNERVKFVEINTENESLKDLIQRYNMTGSGLGVLRNGEYENLTILAFSEAVHNPDILEGKLKEVIEKGL